MGRCPDEVKDYVVRNNNWSSINFQVDPIINDELLDKSFYQEDQRPSTRLRFSGFRPGGSKE